MKKLLLLILVACISATAFAQRDFAQNNMSVFQRRYLNPAFQPNSKIHVGLPILSSFSASAFNTGFKLGGLFSFNGESEAINERDFINELSGINTLGVNFDTDVFSLGFASKKSYFSVFVRERVSFRLNYPKDFMRLLVEGNGGDLLGERLSLDGFGPNFNMYAEMGFGFSHQVNSALQVGVNLKYLSGQLNTTMEKSILGITTDADNYSLNIDGALDFRSSGVSIDNLDQLDSIAQAKYSNFGGNSGFGVDLGATLKVTDKLTVGASVLDIGSINWDKESSTVYENNNFEFEYSGVDFTDFISSDNDNSFGELLDSLEAALLPTSKNKGYTTRLNTQILLNAGYAITPKSEAGIMFRASTQEPAGNFSASAYYAVSVKNWLTTTINASYLNKGIGNVGAGLMVKMGAVQFYTMADNLLALATPESTQNVHFRMGFNLEFGKRKTQIGDMDAAIESKAKAPKAKKEKNKEEKITDDENGLEFVKPNKSEKLAPEKTPTPPEEIKAEKIKKVKEKTAKPTKTSAEEKKKLKEAKKLQKEASKKSKKENGNKWKWNAEDKKPDPVE